MRDRTDRYREVRTTTERLCMPLAVEDHVVQAMPDVSPAKWHLAHTSWFFETFVLTPHAPGYRPLEPRYRGLFNSYYNGVGAQLARPERGHLSRPTVADIYAYRAHVDKATTALLDDGVGDDVLDLVTLGLHHEQQHQELLVTDVKYNLGVNPLRPAYHDRVAPRAAAAPPVRFVEFPGGAVDVGHDGHGFSYDNERPRHRAWLAPFRLASRPATNAEYLAFIEDGGYGQPALWLSDGWRVVQERGWHAPLYWERSHDGEWWTYTLGGPQPLDPHAPVTHLSYYEADALARWSGRRLPTEQEWEHAAAGVPLHGRFLDDGVLQPVAAEPGGSLTQMFGDVWEWTQSAYAPYPGFRPVAGALGEYNGKFMVSQLVLRGGSCATPRSHIRRTYRNFFPPEARWQFSGVRLAADG